jgi:hypothetical protein
LRKPESATNQVRQAWGKWVPDVESVEGEKTPRGEASEAELLARNVL